MGAVAGYVATKVSKIWNSEKPEWQWKLTTILTALLFPGITFNVFFMLNLLIWGRRSSGAVPCTTMFALLVLWFGISVPLVFLGAYFAVRGKPVELPVRTKHIPRQFPKQQFVPSPRFLYVVSGIVPFCAVCTELFFIMSSLWQHQFHCLFGLLTVVVAILAITCAEMSVRFGAGAVSSSDDVKGSREPHGHHGKCRVEVLARWGWRPERPQTTDFTISALIETVVRRQAVGLADRYLVPVGDARSCGNDRRLRDGHRQLDVSIQASRGLA